MVYTYKNKHDLKDIFQFIKDKYGDDIEIIEDSVFDKFIIKKDGKIIDEIVRE